MPDGWAISSVGECFLDVRNGTTATQNKNGIGIPVSRIETIQNRRFDMSRVQHLDDVSDDFVANFRYRPGDIAFSHINSFEHVGKTALYEGLPEAFIHGMNLLRLRLGHEFVDPRFAHFFMQTKFFREEVRQRVGHAVNQVSINQKNLAEVPFIIAPLAEQRRIVGKLELLLGKVSSSQQRLSRVPGLLKRFRQSVLAAACSGKLTADWREQNPKVEFAEVAVERFAASAAVQRTRRGVPETVPVTDVVAAWEMPDTWTVRSAADLLRMGAFIDLKDGNHGANHPKVSDFTDTGLAFITAAQVNGFAIDYEGAYKISGEPLSRLRVGFAKPGDVIWV